MPVRCCAVRLRQARHVMALEIVPSGKDIGAEIRGLKLAEPLAAADLTAVENAFVAHQVLVFRDQPLSPRKFAYFSAQL